MTVHRFFLLALAATVAACSVAVTGPRFSEQPLQVAPQGFTRAYIFRDKRFYLAQASYVARPQVARDDQPIGSLPNGSYLAANISAGRHSVTVGAGDYRTVRYFDARANGNGFIEITDKSRMEGARIAGEAATGAAASMADSVENGDGAKPMRYAAIVGAVDNALRDEAFSGSPERIWGISFPVAADAVNRLQTLSASAP
jgi:hypothetical protein